MTPAIRGSMIAAATAMLALSVGVQSGLSGVWEALRVNGSALPMTDRVVGRDSFTHAVRLHGMTIRLRTNGRFQAALKYRRALLSRGERIDAVPLQTDTWIGTYTLRGDSLRFVPERRAEQQVQPFSGVRSGRRITVSFDYNIVQRKRYTLELARNDSIL